MATEWISPTWRMPENSNQSKFENYSLDFDGSNQLIQVDNDLFGGLEKFSVSFWYNMSTVSGDRAVIGRWSLADAQILIYHQGTTGYWRILFVNNSGVSQGITTTFAATLNTWQFISFIYDGSNVSVQLNNEAVQSQASSGSIKVQTATPSFQIGADNSTRDFTGQLDQVCIFDYALSTDQRNYLYNSGTPQNPMAISGQPPIAYYPLGGSSTGSASTLTIPNESVPSATVFDFVPNDAIDISSDINITSNFSYSFWYRSEASSSGSYEFLLSRENAAASIKQFGIYNVFTSSGRVLANIYDSSGTLFRCDTGSGISENVWHHIAFCYSPSNYIRLYLDGVLEDENTTNIPSSIRSITGESTRIGGRRNNTMFLNGQMSNVQMWSGTLTDGSVSVGATAEGEVATLYNNGVPLFSGTQPQAANLKAWYKLNVDTSIWNTVLNQWEIIDYAN